MSILRIEHVQLAMPAEGESQARAFYGGVLGLTEVDKPPALTARGGCWFETGSVKLHLGVEAAFRPARKAHVALLVQELDAVAARAASLGCEVITEDEDQGRRRRYIYDPFGNRLELLQD
jgi:catechol 2,3-dioxygenase-like lactoylglutathione lyase family enzyme